jgi:hypothetical protein
MLKLGTQVINSKSASASIPKNPETPIASAFCKLLIQGKYGRESAASSHSDNMGGGTYSPPQQPFPNFRRYTN